MSSSQADDFQVIQALQRILTNSDLTKLTRKEVRKQLEQELGGNFSSSEWKLRIKQEIEQFVSRNESGITNETPNRTPNHYDTPNPNKRRKLNNQQSIDYNHNNNSNDYHDTHRRMVKKTHKALIQKSDKDNSFFMKLPGDGAKKRCIIHKYRRKLYVGFREYYDKNGEELPSKKGINLSEEQWDFVVRHINEINAQIKTIKH